MKTTNDQGGFTLVEMMVAVGLFVVVALVTTGALLAMSAAARQVQHSALLMENVGLALDSISYKGQQISTGTQYYCDIDTTLFNSTSLVNGGRECRTGAGGTVLVFRYVAAPSGASTDYAYIYDAPNKQILYKKGTPTLSDLNDAQPLTAPGVKVTKLQFFVTNTRSGLGSSLTIMIQAEVPGKGATKTSFILQRTVSRQTQ